MHAAKVLIKFHVLEVQQQPLAELLRWLDQTPYFLSVHQAHFADMSLGEWRSSLLESLNRSGAMKLKDGIVRNS